MLFSTYSSDNNQYAIIIISCCNMYLFFDNSTELNSFISHISSDDNLFGKLSNLDLLKSACQEFYRLSNMKIVQ